MGSAVQESYLRYQVFLLANTCLHSVIIILIAHFPSGPFSVKAVNMDPGTIPPNQDRDLFNKAIIQRVESIAESGECSGML